VVGGAGHFVFADRADLFNRLVQHVCTLVDHRLDTPSLHGRLRRVRSDVGHILRSPSQTRVRRCDSQHIVEEDMKALAYMELASAAVSETDEHRPVFVVAEEELS